MEVMTAKTAAAKDTLKQAAKAGSKADSELRDLAAKATANRGRGNHAQAVHRQ